MKTILTIVLLALSSVAHATAVYDCQGKPVVLTNETAIIGQTTYSNLVRVSVPTMADATNSQSAEMLSVITTPSQDFAFSLNSTKNEYVLADYTDASEGLRVCKLKSAG
ncbi:hypothetical protein [Kluyvera sp. CHPC 1.251]|uniref:hypothetical protein n=1 Tax=Kluyvera sp. CHPC 1.251 TaxID=2995175 RepID=UPI002FD86FA5